MFTEMWATPFFVISFVETSIPWASSRGVVVALVVQHHTTSLWHFLVGINVEIIVIFVPFTLFGGTCGGRGERGHEVGCGCGEEREDYCGDGRPLQHVDFHLTSRIRT